MRFPVPGGDLRCLPVGKKNPMAPRQEEREMDYRHEIKHIISAGDAAALLAALLIIRKTRDHNN